MTKKSRFVTTFLYFIPNEISYYVVFRDRNASNVSRKPGVFMSIAPPAKLDLPSVQPLQRCCHKKPQITAFHTLAMDLNNIAPPRRSGRPAVPPARLRHAGQPGAAAGPGMAASGETSRDLPSDAAPGSSSPSSPPFDFDSGMKDMTNHLEKEAVGRQTAPAPEISTPTPSSDDEIFDVSGSPATVRSTLGRNKHTRARRPSSEEHRDSSNEDGEASGNDAGPEGGEEDTSRPREN